LVELSAKCSAQSADLFRYVSSVGPWPGAPGNPPEQVTQFWFGLSHGCLLTASRRFRSPGQGKCNDSCGVTSPVLRPRTILRQTAPASPGSVLPNAAPSWTSEVRRNHANRMVKPGFVCPRAPVPTCSRSGPRFRGHKAVCVELHRALLLLPLDERSMQSL